MWVIEKVGDDVFDQGSDRDGTPTDAHLKTKNIN
jgi:hypothetical protein